MPPLFDAIEDAPRCRTAPKTGDHSGGITRVVRGRRALLTRNPNFRPHPADGRPDGFADRVAMTMGKESASLSAAERGQLDLVRLFAAASSERFAALQTRIDARLHSGSFALTEYARLNTQALPSTTHGSGARSTWPSTEPRSPS